MPIYWEQCVGGVEAKNYDTKQDNENYEI